MHEQHKRESREIPLKNELEQTQQCRREKKTPGEKSDQMGNFKRRRKIKKSTNNKSSQNGNRNCFVALFIRRRHCYVFGIFRSMWLLKSNQMKQKTNTFLFPVKGMHLCLFWHFSRYLSLSFAQNAFCHSSSSLLMCQTRVHYDISSPFGFVYEMWPILSDCYCPNCESNNIVPHIHVRYTIIHVSLWLVIRFVNTKPTVTCTLLTHTRTQLCDQSYVCVRFVLLIINSIMNIAKRWGISCSPTMGEISPEDKLQMCSSEWKLKGVRTERPCN